MIDVNFKKQYTARIEEDPLTGDAILPLPEEMIDELGWNEGDQLTWKVNDNGTISLTKKQ